MEEVIESRVWINYKGKNQPEGGRRGGMNEIRTII